MVVKPKRTEVGQDSQAMSRDLGSSSLRIKRLRTELGRDLFCTRLRDARRGNNRFHECFTLTATAIMKMARHSRSPFGAMPQGKSPLQLEQWAAYEAITAQRASEAALKKQTHEDAAILVGRSENWRKAESIKAFVAATMSSIPTDANSVTLERASKWRAWSLGIADSLDPVLIQVSEFSSKPE